MKRLILGVVVGMVLGGMLKAQADSYNEGRITSALEGMARSLERIANCDRR